MASVSMPMRSVTHVESEKATSWRLPAVAKLILRATEMMNSEWAIWDQFYETSFAKNDSEFISFWFWYKNYGSCFLFISSLFKQRIYFSKSYCEEHSAKLMTCRLWVFSLNPSISIPTWQLFTFSLLKSHFHSALTGITNSHGSSTQPKACRYPTFCLMAATLSNMA